MNLAVVALGSNIDPAEHIEKAVLALSGEFTVLARSAVIRTTPVGFLDQPDFLNGVVSLRTDLGLPALRERLKQIEKDLGRLPRAEKQGPREIDLDVIIWNSEIVDKDYYEREFLRRLTGEILDSVKMRCC